MKNILSRVLGTRVNQENGGVNRQEMTTAELVAALTADTRHQPISGKEADRLLVEMDFDEVERRIFGVQDLSVVPADVASHTSIVPSGYPFMDRVKSIVEHRLGLKGIHALR